MSRGSFRSHNKVGETMSFLTRSNSGTTFDPEVFFWSGTDRVSWDLGIGDGYIAGNSLSYTYPDAGDLKWATLRTNQLGNLKCFKASIDSIVGHLDMSGWDRLGGICTGGFGFDVLFNPELTGITHTYSPETFVTYKVNVCDLTGNHDLSMFPNFGGQFFIGANPNLTGITHTYSPIAFTQYIASLCDITGTLDLSMFPKFGKDFRIDQNSNLTRIIHTATTETFTNYDISNCDITGNHDISMLHNLGSTASAGFWFNMANNSNLTGITHTFSPQTINDYIVYGCDIVGNHDISMLPGIEGDFTTALNSNLTGITHTTSASTKIFTSYAISECDITNTHDISMLHGLSHIFRCYDNTNLTNVLFPPTTQTFYSDVQPSASNSAFAMYNCNLDYVNFLVLSGITMDAGSTYGASINLDNNNMSVTDVNHMLVDFNYLASTANPAGWTGVTLDISGTNAAPDTTSGGFNGIAALTGLTSAPNNWVITTS